MASGGSKLKMSEETFDYICTSCAEENLIKESIKYCEVCERFCCRDCVSSHKRIPMLKGHTLLDNSSGPLPGNHSSSPSFPTSLCRIHKGKLLDMYCGDHMVVCCYLCVAIGHKTCNDLHSITDDIDRLYRKADSDNTKSDLDKLVKPLEKRRDTTRSIIQQLRESKTRSIRAVKDYRAEVDQILDTLEDESINELERDFRKMESELIAESQRYDNVIDELKKLEDLIAESEGNVAQMFVCTTIGLQKCTSTKKAENERDAERKTCVLMSFVPVKELKHLVEQLTSLCSPSVVVFSGYHHLHNAKKLIYTEIERKNDESDTEDIKTCDVKDKDSLHQNITKIDISMLSFMDSCHLPDCPTCTERGNKK